MSDNTGGITDFQRHIIKVLKICNGRTSCRHIAECWRGWKHKAGRAAIVGHVGRVGLSMQRRGLVTVHDPKDQFESADLRLTEQGWGIET